MSETINSGIQSVTVDIPLSVELAKDTIFPECVMSIDSTGQIILTPLADVDIISVRINPAANEPQISELKSDSETTRKTISLTANMLAEDSDTTVQTALDVLNQIVVYPTSTKNIFISASVGDELNLITENLSFITYNGYRIKQEPAGWSIFDTTGTLIKSGIDTLTNAKIFVCYHEIEKLTNTSENSESSTTLNELSELTNNFSEASGIIECDSASEQSECCSVLSLYYDFVSCEQQDELFLVTFKDKKAPVESSEGAIDGGQNKDNI